MGPILLFLILTLIGHSSSQDATLEMARTVHNVATKPLDVAQLKKTSYTFSEPPKFDDLAVRRLHFKTANVIDKIWETLNNQQRFAIIKEKGVEKEVLKMFQLIQSDVFAMDSYISRSGVVQALKTASLMSATDDGGKWRASWDLIQELTGKVALFYSHFDNHMSASVSDYQQVTRLAMEDFAKSIIQPGSNQNTAITNALSNLNKIIVATPPQFQGSEQSEPKAALYKLYAVLNEKVKRKSCVFPQKKGVRKDIFLKFAQKMEKEACVFPKKRGSKRYI